MIFPPFLSKFCAHKSELLLLLKKKRGTQRKKKQKTNNKPLCPLKKALPEFLAKFPQKAWTPSKLGTKFRSPLGKVEYYV